MTCNIGIYDKVVRGFYASAFQSAGLRHCLPCDQQRRVLPGRFPIPRSQRRRHHYIKRDYGMNIADFYSKVWWRT